MTILIQTRKTFAQVIKFLNRCIQVFDLVRKYWPKCVIKIPKRVI